jgi:flagellar biosynthesis GTPase FlhF
VSYRTERNRQETHSNKLLDSFKFQAQLKEAQEKLNAQKDLLKGCSKEINEMQAERSRIVKDFNNAQLQLQELQHKETKYQKESKDAAKLVGSTGMSYCYMM